MEKKKIELTFNFCLKPISKENIIKVNVLANDRILIKDAFVKAIKIFNRENNFFKINEDVNFYQLRFMEKSGLPDMDLPSTKKH